MPEAYVTVAPLPVMLGESNETFLPINYKHQDGAEFFQEFDHEHGIDVLKHRVVNRNKMRTMIRAVFLLNHRSYCEWEGWRAREREREGRGEREKRGRQREDEGQTEGRVRREGEAGRGRDGGPGEKRRDGEKREEEREGGRGEPRHEGRGNREKAEGRK